MLLEDLFSLKTQITKLIFLLQTLMLLPKQRICEKCKDTMYIKKEATIDDYIFKCALCRRKISLRRGTFFEGSKLTLWQIFALIYVDIFDIYMSYEQLERQFHISSHSTTCDWQNFIREVYLDYFNTHRERIGGPGIIVQIDESQICKRKYHRGRVLVNQNVWIVGGIDSNGNIFQALTEIRNRQILEGIITQHVHGGSILWTDCWRGYNNLCNLYYSHETVNHSIEFKTQHGVHTNRIEAIWGAIKRKFRHITNKRPQLIGSYLAEYQFKRKFREKKFSAYIKTINEIYRH